MDKSIEVSSIKSIVCAICKEILEDPKIYFCGHSFCAKCIREKDLKECVICNKPTDIFIFKNIILSQISELFREAIKEKKELKYSTVNELIKCNVCRKRFISPKSFPCGHTLCLECAFFARFESGECPTCKFKLLFVMPNELLDDLIEELKIYDPTIREDESTSKDDSQEESEREFLEKTFPEMLKFMEKTLPKFFKKGL